MTDVKNAEFGNWDTDFPAGDESGSKKNGENKIKWMKFDKPGKYQVRLVGKFVKFYRHWNVFPQEDGMIITHPDYKGKDPAWKAGFYPRETYAIHIIDRADGELKVLCKGKGLFKFFKMYKDDNGTNPNGKTAPDFTITVDWPNGNKMAAKYMVMPKGQPNTITDEEIALAEANKAPLDVIYKTTPLEKIVECWDKLPDAKKVPPKRDDNSGKSKTTTASAPAPKKPVQEEIEEKMEDAPAEKDDLFGDDSPNESTNF